MHLKEQTLFHWQIFSVDVEKDCLMIELTGTESKLKAFMELLDGYEILELARTGITGLKRGSDDVIMFD